MAVQRIIEFEKRVAELRIIPVIELEDAKDALPLCDALERGGLPIAEITFRTDAAAEAIKIVGKERPDMLLGAGTVLSPDQVKLAIEAGADFIVSPGFNPKVVNAAILSHFPILPGVNNPTHVEQATNFDVRLLKFFPAEISGGTAMLKALSGPYRDIRFVPTGGISPDNLTDYLALDNVVACGGSWMVDAKMIADGNFDAITKQTRKAVELANSVSVNSQRTSQT